jgi:hypothetical protein
VFVCMLGGRRGGSPAGCLSRNIWPRQWLTGVKGRLWTAGVIGLTESLRLRGPGDVRADSTVAIACKYPEFCLSGGNHAASLEFRVSGGTIVAGLLGHGRPGVHR